MKLALNAGIAAVIGLALLPMVVSAAPPAPEGKLVFEDDFSSGVKSGLEDNLNATDYSRGFHPPGVYHFMGQQANISHMSLFPNLSLGQFSVELDVWDNSDVFVGDVAQGVSFRAQDPNHLYAVLIDPRTGQYAVRKLDGKDKWTDLIAFKPSPLIKAQSEVNRLRVDGKGDTFMIYLNNEQLDSFKDSSYAKGQLGLVIDIIDATNPHMHYDNIKIYSTEQVAQAPPGLPRSGVAESIPLGLLLVCALALLLFGAGLRWRGYRG